MAAIAISKEPSLVVEIQTKIKSKTKTNQTPNQSSRTTEPTTKKEKNNNDMTRAEDRDSRRGEKVTSDMHEKVDLLNPIINDP